MVTTGYDEWTAEEGLGSGKVILALTWQPNTFYRLFFVAIKSGYAKGRGVSAKHMVSDAAATSVRPLGTLLLNQHPDRCQRCSYPFPKASTSVVSIITLARCSA